jgi:outer membrane protein OmpA-like peptidoglycan-associated protein
MKSAWIALVPLLLGACAGEPRPTPNYYPPPAYEKPMPPSVQSGPATPPAIASAGPLKAATIGTYMDAQENELRRNLRGLGVVVTRPGDDIVLTLPNALLFDSNALALNDDGERILSAIAPTLRRYDHTIVYIDGHTDTTGTAEQNMTVSRKRAYEVGGALVRDGVPLARLQARGYGETMLKVKTADKVSEPRNRRIEIHIRAAPAG